jgi:hypothetical protein
LHVVAQSVSGEFVSVELRQLDLEDGQVKPFGVFIVIAGA